MQHLAWNMLLTLATTLATAIADDYSAQLLTANSNITTNCQFDIESKEEARQLFATFHDRILSLMPWAPSVPVLGSIYRVDACTFDLPKDGPQPGFSVHFLLVRSLCKHVFLRGAKGGRKGWNCSPKNHLQSAPVFSCRAILLPTEYFFNPEHCVIEQIYDNSTQ